MTRTVSFSNGALSFVPFNIVDSISWINLNFLVRGAGPGGSTRTVSISVGLYSLSGSTLSLANSISGTNTNNLSGGNLKFISLTATSATQNITPGTWWLGFLASTSGQTNLSLFVQSQINPANAFPGGFIQGRMTVTTNAPPATYATSDLDITGNVAFTYPELILSA